MLHDWIFVTSQYYQDGEIMLMDTEFTKRKVKQKYKQALRFTALVVYWYLKHRYL